ncbi:hypothetical protein AHX85_002332 [Salmonella enterica subsp. enterica]|nr:hypothetical protein [Salmonella enterica subsp. enterica]
MLTTANCPSVVRQQEIAAALSFLTLFFDQMETLFYKSVTHVSGLFVFLPFLFRGWQIPKGFLVS